MLQHKELRREVELAKQGNKVAEQKIFEYLRVRFILLAQRRIDGEVAEDIAHEACLTVFEKYQDSPSDVEFLAWAHQILRNKIGSHLRNTNYRNGIVHSSDCIEDIIDRKTSNENHEFRMTIIACLRKMAVSFPQYIRILNLSNQGYGAEEICRKLGIKPNYFYVLLHRCRGWLFNCIFDDEKKHE